MGPARVRVLIRDPCPSGVPITLTDARPSNFTGPNEELLNKVQMVSIHRSTA